MKRFFIILSTVVLLVMLLLIIVGPFYAKHYINNNAKELIGRSVSLDGLVFNSFNGHLTLRDFRLYEKDDSTIFVSFDTLYIDIEIYKLWFSEIYADEIKLSHPSITILLDKESFNFDDLLPKTDSTVVESNNKKEIKYTLNNIAIKKGYIDYQHIDMQADHSITNLNLEVPGISWGENKAEAGLVFSLDKGGTFQTDFQFDKVSNHFNWNLTVLDLNLSNALPYIKNFASINDINGAVDGSISVFGNLDEIYAADFLTKINIKDLTLVDDWGTNFLGFKRMEIITDTLNLGKGNFQLDSLIIYEPTLLFAIDKDSISNFDKILLSEESDSNKTKEDTTIAQYSYYVNCVRIHQGSVRYKDETIKPSLFSYSVDEIEFAADQIQEGKLVSYYLSALLNGNGTFKGDMHFDPSDPGNGEFNLAIKGCEINDFSALSLSNFAYPVTKGRLNFSTKNSVKDRYLKSHIVLDLFAAELGDKKTDFEPAYNVPLKLALVVLRDPKGRINFDVPAEGDMNNPDFKYRKLIFKVLLNVMLKAAISPYKLLSQAVGADEESIKKIRLDEGQEFIGPEQSSQIDLILQLLSDKPELNAKATLHVDEKQEKAFLVERTAKMHFYATTKMGADTNVITKDATELAIIDAIENDDIELINYLQGETNLVEVTSFDSLASAFLNNTELNEIFNALMDERIQMIENYLNQKNDSSSFTINPIWIDEKSVKKPYYLLEYSAE